MKRINLEPAVSLTNQEVYDIMTKRVTDQELSEAHIIKWDGIDLEKGYQVYFFHEPGRNGDWIYFYSKDDGPAISFLDSDGSYVKSKILVLESILEFGLKEVQTVQQTAA